MKKQNIEKMVAIVIGSIILLSGLGYAIWNATYEDRMTADITSETPLKVITTFDNQNIDTTNESITIGTTSLFKNIGQNINLTLSINETTTDIIDECNNTGDADITYFFGEAYNTKTEVNAGEDTNILLEEGKTYGVNINATFLRQSCPNSVEVELLIE